MYVVYAGIFLVIGSFISQVLLVMIFTDLGKKSEVVKQRKAREGNLQKSLLVVEDFDEEADL